MEKKTNETKMAVDEITKKMIARQRRRGWGDKKNRARVKTRFDDGTRQRKGLKTRANTFTRVRARTYVYIISQRTSGLLFGRKK